MSNTDHKTNIAILGTGIGGMTLAAILSRNVKHSHISVFERDRRDKDQGTGFDISQAGQKAIKKAGAYDKYWSFSRANSDIMKFYTTSGDTPCCVLTPPKLIHRWFTSPESNRQLLREALLESINEENCKVEFECPVNDIRQKGKQIELIGENQQLLGTYDLVIDASGVASPLRKFRVKSKETKADIYTGFTMFHGLVRDPEATCDPRLVKRLGQGTMMSVSGGVYFGMQRYGAHKDDHRASVYYSVQSSTPGEVSEKLQIPRSSNFIEDEETLTKVKEWICNDMGERCDEMYRDCVKKLNSVAIRPLFQHPPNPEFHDDDLPLILIGDALHVVPPYTGAGGNLALADASDLSDFILKHEQNIQLNDLRQLEQKFLKRAAIEMKAGDQRKEGLKQIKQKYDTQGYVTMRDFLGGNQFILVIATIFTWIYFIERFLGIRND